MRYLCSEPRVLGKVPEYLETDKHKNRKHRIPITITVQQIILKISGLV